MSVLSLLLCVALVVCSVVNAQTAPTTTANDLSVLNYALTLENLESAFYTRYQAVFTQANFTAAGFPSNAYAMLDVIRLHEQSHVAILQSIILARGGTPNPPCNYSFPVTSVATYIAVAAALENTGVTAYDGAISGITAPDLVQAAATVATVEGRHAAYLNQLNGNQNPFPQYTDNATLPSVIYGIASQFITGGPAGCASLPLNVTRPNGVAYNNTSGGTVHTGLGSATYTTAQYNNDNLALGYALTLENLEMSFYAYGQNRFTVNDFIAANLTAQDYSYFGQIGAHEAFHSAALNSTLIARNAHSPVRPCIYNFSSVQTVAQYTAFARALENTGTLAYDGAANTLTDTNLLTFAATVATVEGRHISYLNNLAPIGLAATSPFPNITDNALSPSAVLSIVAGTGFIVTCPSYSPASQLPVILVTSVTGDPRFRGFFGQEFQVHGIPDRFFNVLSAPQLQLNAKFIMMEKGASMGAAQQKQLRLISEMKTQGYALPDTLAWTHPGTYLGEVGLKLASHRIFIKAGGYAAGFESLTVDGQTMAVSATPINLAQGYTITHPTPSVLTVTTPLVSFTISNSDKFVNIDAASLTADMATAVSSLDGLLGQTANPASKIIDGKSRLVYDYLLEGADIFADDFTANKFVAQQ